MATRTILIDDLDGSSDDVATAHFGLDGQAYEIDLTPANRAQLIELLQPYIAAGRRIPPPVKRGRKPRAQQP